MLLVAHYLYFYEEHVSFWSHYLIKVIYLNMSKFVAKNQNLRDPYKVNNKFRKNLCKTVHTDFIGLIWSIIGRKKSGMGLKHAINTQQN